MRNVIRLAGAKVQRSSPVTITLLAAGYEVLLGLLDYTTPEEMSFTIFYLLGVAFAGYGAGSRSALVLSGLSAGIMAIHERKGESAPLSVGLLLWNTSTRFLLFYAAGWLTAEITRLNRHLSSLVDARTLQLQTETEKHKSTSTQLGEALERLRAIIAGMPIILLAVDRRGIITFEDGRALASFGTKPGAHVGQSVLKAYSQSRDMGERMRRALEGQEFSATVHIGSSAFETWYSPAHASDGTVSGYTVVAVNVTDRCRLERQILEISDREQARIGQEIHDGLGQQLVSLAFDANALVVELTANALPQARTAQRIADYLDAAITDSRRLARGLFPIRLETEGLPSALEGLARATQERFAIPCRFDSGDVGPVVVKALATHLYRIAQEAVANAVRHSQAKKIVLTLQARDDHVELVVEDDGIGLCAPTLKERTGMGLHIMEYRARSIGGSFSIEQADPGGTRVCCRVPGRLA